jgi:hypothetical protein
MGGVSTGGVFIGGTITAGNPAPEGEEGNGGVAAGPEDAGGAPSAASGSIGDGGETEPCGPLDVEFIEPSELDTSSWASEETCDSEAEAAEESFASYDREQEIDLGELAGKWTDGSGSTRIELMLDEAGASTVKFGDVPLPELDLEGAYLTGIDERDPSRVENYWFHPDLVRGFAYTLISAQWLGDEMSFSFRLTEPWEDWCAAQEPVRGAYCYYCAPMGSRSSLRDESCEELSGCFTFEELSRQVRLDCGRVALCQSSVCWCSKEGCRANPLSFGGATVRTEPTDPNVIQIVSSPVGEATSYLRRE